MADAEPNQVTLYEDDGTTLAYGQAHARFIRRVAPLFLGNKPVMG